MLDANTKSAVECTALKLEGLYRVSSELSNLVAEKRDRYLALQTENRDPLLLAVDDVGVIGAMNGMIASIEGDLTEIGRYVREL